MTRIRNRLFSVRFQLVGIYLLIIVTSFAVIGTFTVQLVGDYLFTQRLNEQRYVSALTAGTVARSLEEKDGDKLYQVASEASRKYAGRIVIVDGYGTVQADTLSRLNGERLNRREVVSVLTGGSDSAYGIYEENDGVNRFWRALGFASDASIYGVYASAITYGDKVIGVLLYSASEETLYSRIDYIRSRMLIWMIGVCVASLILMLALSTVLTKPLDKLKEGIEHMAQGDFAYRVKVRGRSEYAQLADTFNMMSEKLENLEDARSRFVSNASHELKTPLATIKVLIQTLIYGGTEDPAMLSEFLSDIDKEIDRLSAVISDLLTLTNMDSGEMRLHLENMHIDEMLAQTVRLLNPLAEKRGIDITLQVTDAPVIEGDAVKMQQVFYNLVDNAIKYSHTGGHVLVSLNETPKSAVIKVADNGIGIPEEDLKHIFDRFYRVDKARSRETGGTGLGLSIVSQMIQLHGGNIKVESRLNEGSTFTVTLPK